MSDTEEWRPVRGYEGLYEVSSLGRVRSLRRNREMRAWTDDRGYTKVQLHKAPQKMRTPRVHRIVAEAFIGPAERGMQCRHKNGNKADNRLSNIEYGTARENMRDKIRHGRTLRGEQNVRAKLTWADVDQIRASTERSDELAQRFGVARNTINVIRRFGSWIPSSPLRAA